MRLGDSRERVDLLHQLRLEAIMLSESTVVLNAAETINEFVTLRIALEELQQHVKAMQPAFHAACASFGTNQIQAEQALITRKLTPGRWDYSPSILCQEDLLKKLKLQFQKDHEPIAGREVIWAVKLLFPGLDDDLD
jgi:hypothetical protein